MTISTSQFINPTSSVADRVPNTSFHAFYDVAHIQRYIRVHSIHLEWQRFEERIISLREARRLAELDLKKEIIPQQLNRSHMQMRSCYYVG